jgi:hypothetical protein
MKRTCSCPRLLLAMLVASVWMPVAAFCQDADVAGHAADVAAVRADYNAARIRHDAALATLVAARREVVQQLQDAPPYVQAQLSAQEAHDKYQAAGKTAVAALKDHDPAYKELLARQQQIEDELREARQNAATTTEAFNELYNQKSAVSRQLEEMEQKAIAASSGQDLRHQWESASARVQTLTQQMQGNVENAAAVVQARDALNQATRQLQQVGAQLAQADAAYQQSLYQQDLYGGTLGYSTGGTIDTTDYGSGDTGYAYWPVHREHEHHADHDRGGEPEHHETARPAPAARPAPPPRSNDSPKGPR